MSVALKQTLYRALTLYEEGKQSNDLEKLHEADTLCDAVVALDPENADAWQIAGLARLARGLNEGAKEAFERAIAVAPEDAGNYVNLATANLLLGKTELALRGLRHAIELQSDLPEAYYNLGNTLVAVEQPNDAAAAFRKAVELRADYPEALNNLGQILKEDGKGSDAILLFERAIECAPGYGPPWSNLCAALAEAGNAAEAIEAGRRAVILMPDDANTHFNLGNAFAAARIVPEAIACFHRSIEADRSYPAAYVNLGVMQHDLGNIDAALREYDRALAIEADNERANWNKALTLLLAGRFEEAWPLYEARWGSFRKIGKPKFAEPEWDGSEGNGTILLYCEQAFGDAIQFLRFLPLVRQRGWRIVLECAPNIQRLFEDSGLADAVIAFRQPRPAFECWLPIMSLPRIFGISVDTVPAEIPYLGGAKNQTDGKAVPRREDTLNVGIVWQGSLTNKPGHIRSCRLTDFAHLRKVDGVALFSLQSQISSEDAALLEEYSIPDLESGLMDFADTAAVVRQMELVISIDTAMVHLSGALGCPTWVILPVFPDWRWMRDREDSPWYPGMRLFRQKTFGDWTSLFGRVAEELDRYCRERRKV